MKRLTTLIALLMLVLGLGAATVTVGTVTQYTNFFPIFTCCTHNYSQQIYRQSQINHFGVITKIGFYRMQSCYGELSESHNWTIYMGHITRSSFASPSDWEPLANLTQVFSGSVLNEFPEPGGWMEITLQTPFGYNNIDNLVVAIHENTPGWGVPVDWGGFTIDQYSGSYAGIMCFDSVDLDPNNPSLDSMASYEIAAIKLEFTPEVAPPLTPVPVRPLNNATLSSGDLLEWTLPYGSPPASGYDVYIDGSLLSANQAGNRCAVHGLSVGPHTWYVIARNPAGVSPPSASCGFVYSFAVAIGFEDEDFGLPIETSSHYNYSQSIFLQSEMGINNQGNDEAYCSIEKISFFYDGTTVPVDCRDWVIYVGHTSKTEFSSPSDWVPVSEMVQVFAGQVSFLPTPGWVGISLDTPFLYDTTSNIVIAVDENTPGYCNWNPYFHNSITFNQNRSIAFQGNHNANPDPATPPDGTLVSAIPNIMMHVGQLQTGPRLSLAPNVLDFELLLNGETSEGFNVTATNMGIGTLNLAAGDISIIGDNAAEFSFDPSNLPVALGHGESVSIPVSLTGVTAGQLSATLRIVYEGQNHDVGLIARVMPTGTIVIGEGNQTQQLPFATQFIYSGSATLYKAEEINGSGSLQMLAWDCAAVNSNHTPEISYRIWAKNTNADCMNFETWEDLRSGMTLLKVGSFVPTAGSWQMFELDVPFVYTGVNLIIYVESQCDNWGQHNYWFKYSEVDESRHLSFNYNSPPTVIGNWNGQIPNIMLHFVPNLADDLCALDVSGTRTSAVGETSHYSVRIRNNGSDAQTNYQVKLVDTDNNVLGAVNGPAIDSGEIIEVLVPWTPTTAGQKSMRGKVEMSGDGFAGNNLSKPFQVDVIPVGMQSITIGEGNQLSQVPMGFDSRTSIYERIFVADELGFASGTITSVIIYNQFVNELLAKPTQVFLASTNLSTLNSGLIPATQMLLVFDGLVDYPAGENNVVINFQTPFVHLGGNLLIMFYRPLDEHSYALPNHFFSQPVGDLRARYDCGPAPHGVEIDPYSPPHGFVCESSPLTTFLYSLDLLQNDLGAISISGNPTPVVGVTSTYTVRIRNSGVAMQDNYTVKLIDAAGVELASIAGPPIEVQQSLDVDVPWAPTSLGTCSFYGKVVLDGEAFETNNCTSEIEVLVYPPGAENVTAEVILLDQWSALHVSWSAAASAPVELSGYMVYRMRTDQMSDEAAWHPVTPEPILDLCADDLHWGQLPSGNYVCAVKAVYEGDLQSLPSFSNSIQSHVPSGTVSGTVRSRYGVAIAGAKVSNGIVFSTTNLEGEFNLPIPAGTHALTASAADYYSQTLENITVEQGSISIVSFVLDSLTAIDDPQIPVMATALNGNYPNPFNPETTISYSVMKPGRVRLQIYNIKGQLVRSLVDEDHAAGHYKRVFDGKDNNGRSLASGVYLIRMTAPGYEKVSKMMLMK